MTRTTRSGATFSPYELGTPFVCDVDVEDLLRLRIAELDATDQCDAEELDEELESDDDDVAMASPSFANPSSAHVPANSPRRPVLLSINTSLQPRPPVSEDSCPPSPLTPLPPTSPPLSEAQAPHSSSHPTSTRSIPVGNYRGKAARQKGSHRRRANKRKAAGEATPNFVKPSTQKHVAESMQHIVQVDIDAEELPVNSSGFGGLRQSLAKDKRDADALCQQPGWHHLRHDGEGSIPVVDRKQRMIVCIGGMPANKEGWKAEVVDELERAVVEGARNVKFSKKEKEHKRGVFPATAIGVSHGGGEKRPGNRRLSKSVRSYMESLLANQAFQRASGFLNQLFYTYNRPMYAVYAEHQARLHASNPRLRRNFENSVFACLTVNSGPNTTTDPHADSANRPDGWCGITCFGPFNYKCGGQLVLWDLKLVIDFPPGCTIFIPSALLVHSNTPIQPGERRYSMTQYTAGGLFRWVANGFQTQESFWDNASEEVRKQWLKDRATRWERGLQLFPVLP